MCEKQWESLKSPESAEHAISQGREVWVQPGARRKWSRQILCVSRHYLADRIEEGWKYRALIGEKK